jgi:hypothetical protein
MDYSYNYSEDQIVKKFQKCLQDANKQHFYKDENVKVQFSQVDFRPLILQRKFDKLQEATATKNLQPKDFSMKEGELISILVESIEQTGRTLDQQSILRDIIKDYFDKNTRKFNTRLLIIILVCQYIPQYVEVFMEVEQHLYANLALCVLQGFCALYMTFIEVK